MKHAVLSMFLAELCRRTAVDIKRRCGLASAMRAVLFPSVVVLGTLLSDGNLEALDIAGNSRCANARRAMLDVDADHSVFGMFFTVRRFLIALNTVGRPRYAKGV